MNKRSQNFNVKDLSQQKTVSTIKLKELFTDEIKRLCYKMQEESCEGKNTDDIYASAITILQFAYLNLYLYTDAEREYIRKKIYNAYFSEVINS